MNELLEERRAATAAVEQPLATVAAGAANKAAAAVAAAAAPEPLPAVLLQAVAGWVRRNHELRSSLGLPPPEPGLAGGLLETLAELHAENERLENERLAATLEPLPPLSSSAGPPTAPAASPAPPIVHTGGVLDLVERGRFKVGAPPAADA